jgi:hypothetical protein
VNNDIIKVRLSCPQDAIAVVPHLLGFHPSPGSLAIIVFAGHRNTGVVRCDIPPASQAAALTRHLIRCLASQRADEVILIGYGPAAQVTPALTRTREALDGLLTIGEILRVTNGRWWSLMCENPACCPPGGSPCDIASTVPAAQFTVLGSAPLPSRADLAATLSPVTGPEAARMRTAIRRHARQLLPGIARAPFPAAYLSRVAALTALPVPLSDDDSAELLVLLRIVRFRDEAWVLTEGRDPDGQVAFWTDMTRRAHGRYAAAPASLLAYAAVCMTGDGALASIAVERALRADPSYSLALLLNDMLWSGKPPQQFRLPLTSADLAGHDVPENSDEPGNSQASRP